MMNKKTKKIAVMCGLGAAAAFAVKNSRDKRQDAWATDGAGQTVLITGASGGIGRELAFVFAAHHFDLVLVARNLEAGEPEAGA